MEEVAQVVADKSEIADDSQLIEIPSETLSKIGGGIILVNI